MCPPTLVYMEIGEMYMRFIKNQSSKIKRKFKIKNQNADRDFGVLSFEFLLKFDF